MYKRESLLTEDTSVAMSFEYSVFQSSTRINYYRKHTQVGKVDSNEKKKKKKKK